MAQFEKASQEEKAQHDVMRESTTFFKDGMRRLFKNPLAVFSILLVTLIVAIFVVPMIVPYGYSEVLRVNGKRDASMVNLPHALLQAGTESHGGGAVCLPHILGTDELGRDYFIRVVYGARVSLAVGFFASIIVLIIGLLYGSISGYVGGKVDIIMMRIVDIIYSLPDILMVIMLSVVLNQVLGDSLQGTVLAPWHQYDQPLRGLWLLVIAGCMSAWSGGRSCPSRTTSMCWPPRPWAPGVPGSSASTFCPTAFPSIFISTALQIPSAIFTESFLSFIGLGVQAPMPSLGSLANLARGGHGYLPLQDAFPGAGHHPDRAFIQPAGGRPAGRL